MGKRGRVVAGIAAAALVVLGAGGATLLAHHNTAPTSSPAAAAPRGPSAPTAAQANDLSARLRSGDLAKVLAAVSSGHDAPPPQTFVSGLARVRSLVFDAAHFTPVNATTGAMPASMTSADGTVTHWVAYVRLGPAGWTLIGTSVAR